MDNAPLQGQPTPAVKPNADPLTDPTNAPLGTIVVFSEDGLHPTHIAIRWVHPNNKDERLPWLILGSDGPQRLDHDAVEGCQVVNIPAVTACAYAATPRRWLAGLDAAED